MPTRARSKRGMDKAMKKLDKAVKRAVRSCQESSKKGVPEQVLERTVDFDGERSNKEIACEAKAGPNSW
jgi:hypothetical protein